MLARLFLQSIFISVDISIREGHLFCDCLCDNGPLYSGQVSDRKKVNVLKPYKSLGLVNYKIITYSRDALKTKEKIDLFSF